MAHLDPRMITPVPLAFTVKQLVHGSVLGGYAHMTFVAIEQYMLSHFVRYVADRGLFTTFSLQIEHQLGPWANFSISICCVAIWLTIFGLYYRHKFPNQTRLNLKKFNLLFQAVHNKLVNSRKVSCRMSALRYSPPFQSLLALITGIQKSGSCFVKASFKGPKF